MTEALLLALIVAVWLSGQRARDWYVVEWRTCSDGTLAPDVFSSPPRAFDKPTMRAYKVAVETTWRDAITLRQQGGGKCTITQIAFEELDAALLDVERFKRLLPFNAEYPFQKLYLWRVVARSRRNALVLPPRTYLAKDAHLLLEYPQHSWFSSKARQETSSVMEAMNASAPESAGLSEARALHARLKMRAAAGTDQERPV